MTIWSSVVIAGTRPSTSTNSRPLPIGQRDRALLVGSERPLRRHDVDFAAAVADDQAVDSLGSFEGGGANLAGRNDGGGAAADHADSDDQRFLARRYPKLDIAGRYRAKRSNIAEFADSADLGSVGRSQSEPLGDRGSDGQRPPDESAWVGPVHPAIGGDSKRQHVAGDQAFDRSCGNARLVVRLGPEGPIGLIDPVIGHPNEAEPDRKQRRCQDQQQLGRGRQFCKALGGRGHRSVWS